MRTAFTLLRHAPAVLWAAAAGVPGPVSSEEPVFVNEIHYDNTGTDSGEGIEIAGPAGTDLARFRLELYNGNNGSLYGSIALEGIIDDEGGSGFGAVFFAIPGLQNGSPDGFALFDTRDQRVLAFSSYEGEFAATGGAAVGRISTDLGVAESGSTPVGHSLQRVGEGRLGADFSWRPPSPASPGRLNDGQFFSGEAAPLIVVAVADEVIAEVRGDLPASTSVVVRLDPAPAAARRLWALAEPPGEVASSSEVVVGPDGTGVFEVVAVADGLPDGDRRVVVRVVDPQESYDPGSVTLVVRDAPGPDVRAGTLRVATLNVENGVGAEGSAEFAAVRRLVDRIDPDVVAFQEVQGDDGFADVVALARACGFGDSREHLAFEGDGFETVPFQGGDFVFNQFLVVASRHPIAESVQVGRGGVAREHARFPLFVRIDVPGVEEALDPALVVVHHKAGSSDADTFRRAVESFRIARFLESRGFDGEDRNVIVLGDFNDDRADAQPAAVSTAVELPGHVFPDGSMLPPSYRLGADLAAAGARQIGYRPFPEGSLSGLSLRVLPAVQVDGRERTRNTLSRRRLDYLVVSNRLLENGPVPAEVYNSDLEPVSMGLPKAGPPPPRGSSRLAGDHQAVFADFTLDGRPRLRLSSRLAPSAGPTLDEHDGPGALEAVVRLPAPVPAGESLEVSLVVTPPEEAVARSKTLVFGPGETERAVLVDLVRDAAPDPDRTIVLAASAPGLASGFHRVVSRNRQPTGDVVLTRYLEPAGSTSHRALELQNVSGRTLNLFDTPIEIRGEPGPLASVPGDLLIEDGLLPPGGVLVLGQEGLAADLVARGLIDDPGGDLGRFEGQTFFGSGGRVGFVLARWNFDGNDSIEILVDRVLSDVFGTVGGAPGLEWTGGGLSTRDDHLRRRGSAPRGSAGWTDPSLRFEAVAAGTSSFDGFGTGVEFTDAFAAWSTAAGLSDEGDPGDPLADPDGDGARNAVEFALATVPTDPASRPVIAVEPDPGDSGAWIVTFLQRREGAAVVAQVSSDLQGWRDVAPAEASPPIDLGDGTERATWRIEPPGDDGASVRFFRLRVELL